MKFIDQSVQIEVCSIVKKCFSDFNYFDKVVGEKLKKLVEETNDTEIDVNTTKNILSRHYDLSSFNSKHEKNLLDQIGLIFKTTYVLILSLYEVHKSLQWTGVNELLREYGKLPEFSDLNPNNENDLEELHYLLKFRNMLKVALLIIPAKFNKSTLIKIAARLEGSNREYITGGGQTIACTRRVSIYRKEGKIAPRSYVSSTTARVTSKKHPQQNCAPPKTSTPSILIPSIFTSPTTQYPSSLLKRTDSELDSIADQLHEELCNLAINNSTENNDKVQLIQRLLQITGNLQKKVDETSANTVISDNSSLHSEVILSPQSSSSIKKRKLDELTKINNLNNFPQPNFSDNSNSITNSSTNIKSSSIYTLEDLLFGESENDFDVNLNDFCGRKNQPALSITIENQDYCSDKALIYRDPYVGPCSPLPLTRFHSTQSELWDDLNNQTQQGTIMLQGENPYLNHFHPLLSPLCMSRLVSWQDCIDNDNDNTTVNSTSSF
eukprot:gene5493-7605_t